MIKLIDPEFAQTLFNNVLEASAHQDKSTRFLQYRQILEELFFELTKDENRYFDDLHARTNYIFEEKKVDELVQKGVNFTRQRTNKVIHDKYYELQEKDEWFCLKNLSYAIRYFSGVDIPMALRNTFDTPLKNIRESQPESTPRPKQEYYDFFAIVEKVKPARATDKFRVLLCKNDPFGTFSLKLWNNKDERGVGSDLTPFADLVQDLEYSKIYVTNVQAYPERENEFFATNTSLIVLQPDYLIEAKGLSECIQYNAGTPYSHLLSRFNKGSADVDMLTGTLVGKRLDDLTRDQKADFTNTFKKFMQEQSFGMLSLANNNGNYDKEHIQKIYDNARVHENNILRHVQSSANKSTHIEPTFISAEYGLLGRLDALYEDKTNPNHKEALELKAGSFPPTGIKPSHKAQALAYDLMLRSVYPKRIGTNSILYSKSLDGIPLRHVDSKKFYDKLRLLMVRNKIVANEIKLSLGNMGPLEHMVSNEVKVGFAQEFLNGFRMTYLQLTPLEKAYFQEYTAFAFRELRIAKMGPEDINNSRPGFAALWKLSKTEKMANYDALVNLEIKSVTENSVLELYFSKDNLSSSSVSGIRKGEKIVLYPTPDSEILNPLHSQILKGNLTEIHSDKLIVTLINKQVDSDFFRSCRLWAVERDFSESSYKDWLLSLYRFMKTPPAHKALLFGQTEPQFEQLDYTPIPGLNANQNKIIASALNAKNYFLIQGPPGTGKTSTVLCNIVDQLIKKEENVLIIAFTNRAVDEICDKLDKKLKNEELLIRLGRHSTRRNSWAKLTEELKLNELYEKVNKARVIVSTQSSFSSGIDLLNIKTFDTLIVDEASQLTELHLVGFLHKFKRFILIGDEKQLPAVVMQSEAKSQAKSPLLKEIDLSDLRDSLFTRLLLNAKKKHWYAADELIQHYRMHEDIADFINRKFYGGRLKIGTEEQKASIQKFSSTSSNPIEQALAKNRVIFIPSPKENRSKVNEYEAQVVKRVLDIVKQGYGDAFTLGSEHNTQEPITTSRYVASGQDQNSAAPTVGVITPFRAQIATIRKYLGPEYHDLTVDTVERFQGSERDVIIISYALGSQVYLQSVSSFGPEEVDRKLNVALSRAKEFIILTGTEEIMRLHKHISVLLDEIRQKGGYLELGPQRNTMTTGSVVGEEDLF